MDMNDFDLSWGISTSPRMEPPAPFFNTSANVIPTFPEPRQNDAAPNWLQSTHNFNWELGYDLPAPAPQQLQPFSTANDDLSALLSSTRLSIDPEDGRGLRTSSSEDRLDRLLGLHQYNPALETTKYFAPAQQSQFQMQPPSQPVSNTVAGGLTESFGLKYDLGNLLDDVLDFNFSLPPINIDLAEDTFGLVSPTIAPCEVLEQPQAQGRLPAKRSAARNAEANIRRIIDDGAQTSEPTHVTITPENLATPTSITSFTGKMKVSTENRQKRRTYHRSIDISLSDAELAEQLLGIDGAQYSSLSVAQRNIVASARYRQKKMNRHSSLEKVHETLCNENKDLKAQLGALESEIASYRSAFSSHMSSEFLD